MTVAAISMAMPFAPAYDPWAWLVWGRELLHWDLDTSGGPSWKPLPVLITAPLSVLGDGATWAWSVLARAGFLLALCFAYRLAARLAGEESGRWGAAAGAVAVTAFLLSPSEEMRTVRYFAQGNCEPLLAALLLWAVERHLDGRRDHAFVLLGLAGLIRPEAWLFLGVYGALLWVREPRRRALVAMVWFAMPALWLGGDWLGSGDPFTGSSRAQVLDAGTGAAGSSLETALGVVIPPVWALAIAAVLLAPPARRAAIRVLSVAALAWLAVVVAMASLGGFAGIARFMLPAAAVLVVLAGVGAVSLKRALPPGRSRAAACGALIVVGLAFAAPRVAQLPDQERVLSARASSQSDLRALADDIGGTAGAFRCGRFAVDQTGVALESKVMLAWVLDVPMRAISHQLRGRPGIVATRMSAGRYANLLRHPDGAVELGRRGDWVALAVGCAARGTA